MRNNCDDLLVKLYEMRDSDKEVLLVSDQQTRIRLSYKQIWVRSGYLAAKLRETGARKGDEVVIRCENLEYFIYAFWACVHEQCIAIPVDSNNKKNGNAVMDLVMKKLESVYMFYDSDDLVGDKSIKGIDIRSEKEAMIVCEDVPSLPDNLSSDDIVYILFSSGTTGEPNGVMISKSNISASVKGIIEHYELTNEDRYLSWSPLSYCYGLIPFHILPIFIQASQCFMASNYYVQSPLAWLDLVDEFRATRISSIPFALRHFINIYNNTGIKPNWDLTMVKSMYIGGEQVNSLLCKEFTEITDQFGLNIDKIYPVYGLSESTMFCVGNKLGYTASAFVLNSDSLEIGKEISCRVVTDEHEKDAFLEMGHQLSTVEVKICGIDGEALPEDHLGYVYAGGPCITKGYFKNEEKTNEIIKDGKWLYTGDVGFLHNGSLIIVGREKELVVSNAKKYSSNTIENIINLTDETRPYGIGIVCNGNKIKNDSEKVIVFFEQAEKLWTDKELREFISYGERVKAAVYDAIGLIIDEVLVVEKFPRTSSGKVFRRQMEREYSLGRFDGFIERITNMDMNKETIAAAEGKKMEYSKESVSVKIADILNEMFQIEITNYDKSFTECGIISINIPPFVERLNEEFNLDIQVSAIFSYSNLSLLAQYIYDLLNDTVEYSNEDVENDTEDDKIAIVGMSCRFPAGSNNIDSFWKALVSGTDGIVDIPSDRWDVEKYYSEDENEPGKMYCNKGGYLDYNVNSFDAGLFNVTPQEAQNLDPQQRLLLELVWEAFENAGMNIRQYYGSDTGVYLGISSNEFSLAGIYSGDPSNIGPYSLTGGSFSTICGRVSYLFGFEGPCFSVDTACSSALTALHLACNAIKSGETSMAVVAGVNLLLSPVINIAFSKLHATSKDGTCKSFDDSANGYGRAEGGGVILVKKLSDAIRDKDEILGVIVGSGINQDGRSNGLTAPNGASQAKLMKRVLRTAKLRSDDIDYVEMHGTGTPLGDPIEVNAVAEIYGANRTHPLKIGSVKSNIGHLEPAAGMASIIKVLLALRHDVIPANLHFNMPNSFIPWDKIPVEVVDKKTTWLKSEKLRCAAVNGFGFGGSNAHVIIEEFREATPAVTVTNDSVPEGLDYILKISAKTQKSLRNYMFNYVSSLEACKDEEFTDFLYTVNRGRVDFHYRMAITAKSRTEMISNLKAIMIGGAPAGAYNNFMDHSSYRKERKVVMMFTGQGSQYISMGKKLYEANPVFRESMLRCDKLFRPYLLKSLVQLIYEEDDSELIEKTVYAQPLIFSINLALYNSWRAVGVKPEIVTGHSIGEYVAAVASRVLSLEDAVKMVAIRGRLMDMAPGSGSMGTIFTDKQTLSEIIGDDKEDVSIAAHNGKDNYVISGKSDVVERILKTAEDRSIRVKRLKVSHAFHSLLMDPILEDFKDYIGGVTFKEAQCRYLSCLYARELKPGEILDANYWTRHVRESVRFYEAIDSIENKEEYAFLEVGSNRVLSALCKMNLNDNCTIVASLKRNEDDATQIACAISELYVRGVDIDWSKIIYHGKERWKRLLIPNYPYDKDVYSLPLMYDRSVNNEAVTKVHPLLGEIIESPKFDNTIIFQRKFRADEPYFMSEHIIFGVPISPAAAHISLVLSAIKEAKNPISCTIKTVEFRIPLAVSGEGERVVQICLKDLGNDILEFEIVSREAESNSGWETHATGKVEISYSKASTEKEYTFDEMEKWEPDKVVPEEGTYRLMRETGFNLGDGFRRIMKVAHFPGSMEEYVSDILPLESVPKRKDYEVYPGTIDSIFQTGTYQEVAKRLNDTELILDIENDQTMIPYYLDELTYNFEDAERLLAYTSIIDTNSQFITFNVDVFNEKRQLVFKLRKLMAKITNKKDLMRGIQNMNMPFYYLPEWVEKDEVSEIANNGSEKFFIVAEDIDEASKLVEAFSSYSIEPGLILNRGIASNTTYVIDQYDAQNWKDLVNDLATNTSFDEIVFIYCNGCNYIHSKVSDRPIKGLFFLIKAMIECENKQKLRLKIITKNAESFDEKNVLNINQAPFWGLSKVLGIEFPNIYRGIVDIGDESLTSTDFINEVMGKSNDEVCLFGGKRFVQRIIKTSFKNERSESFTVNGEKSYLITGGTGAVGMVYVDALVESGAKKILLCCRKQPSEAVMQRLKDYKELSGVRTELVFCDVSDAENAKAAFANIPSDMLPIGGIIHAAGVLDDRMITEQTWESFEKVLKPKVFGAVNVIDNVDTLKLDFVVFVSSITSIIGNVGQSNYAAANYFMNQYSTVLRNNGISAYTVCWGPWQTGGMANSNKNIAKNMDNMGLSAFSNEVGKNLIIKYFEHPENKLIIADIDWKKMSFNLKSDNQLALLETLVSHSTQESDASEETEKIYDALNQMGTKEERIDYVCLTLQKICASIMGFNKYEQLDTNSTLGEQGADSLIVFTMRSAINKVFKTDVEVSTFYNYPTLSNLAVYLVEDVLDLTPIENASQYDEELESALTDLGNLLE